MAYVGPHWAKRVTFLGTAPGPGGHVGFILGLCWLTLSHMGGPSWAKRYISRHRAQSRWACWVHIGLVLAYVGPHGRAVVGQEGCISRHRAYVGLHGRAVVAQEGCISKHRVHIGRVLAYVGPDWAKRVTFLGTAPGPGGHVGCILGLCWLTLSHMGGPSWAKRYISSHRARSRWACWVHIGLVLAYVGPHGQGTGLFI